MMLVTTAPNDKDLVAQLRKRLGDSIVPANIPFGDVNCTGFWLNGERVGLLFERKKMGDIISCIETGRYLKQWQDAHEAGWERQYLFAEIERKYREGPKSGMVEVRRGRQWMTHRPEIEWYRIDAFLSEVWEYLGVRTVQTYSAEDTARKMVRLYMLFQKSPEEHQTLHKIFTPPRLSEGLLDMFKSPSLLRRASAQLPHIGWELSKAAEQQFGSVRAMVNATEEEWMEIPKIGKKIAGDIVRELEKDWSTAAKGS